MEGHRWEGHRWEGHYALADRLDRHLEMGLEGRPEMDPEDRRL